MLFTVSSPDGFYKKTYSSLVLKIHTKKTKNKKPLNKSTVQEFHLCRHILTNGAVSAKATETFGFFHDFHFKVAKIKC